MVDTITLQFNIRRSSNYYVYTMVKEKKIKGFSYIPKNYEKKGVISYCAGIAPFGIYYNVTHSYINVTVKPILILKHTPVANEYSVIEDACKKVIFENLKIPKEFISSITLNRIDFNVDYRISDELVREIIYNLMRKN